MKIKDIMQYGGGKIKKTFFNPNLILIGLLRKSSKIWNDELYCCIMFMLKMGKWPNLSNPITYQEKLNWIKLHFHDTLMTTLVDKYEVKKYVEKTIGKQYVVKGLGVWTSFDEIDFDSLPNSFVLKCTHDSASYVIVHDKSKLDKVMARRRIESHLKNEYFYQYREWPYKNCKPRVMAEELLDAGGEHLADYKFFCFNGIPKILYVSHDASEDVTTDFFDMDFNHLDLKMKDPNSVNLPPCPHCFEEMKMLAKKLSSGFPHVRIDFYVCNNQIYFGEFTFFHNAGFQNIYPEKWNEILGSWIELPQKI